MVLKRIQVVGLRGVNRKMSWRYGEGRVEVLRRLYIVIECIRSI